MPDSRPGSFTRRLRTRREQWWGRPFRWFRLQSYRDASHRVCERFTRRFRDDSDAAWRCCAYWPRALMNKWNSREFAQKHGCRVPSLYWYGRSIAQMPWASLPSRYALRPVWGAGRQGVHVVADERELVRNVAMPDGALRRTLLGEHGPVALTPLLVEEFIPSEAGEGRLPLEYKCHAFGGMIAAVQVIERTGRHSGAHRFYTSRWDAFPDAMSTSYPLAPVRPAPRCLDEMLAAASRMGEAIGTYMRIDFFASDAGPVFNEFASTPQLFTPFTPYCEELFGALWQQQLPHAV
jgi:hypothetical protein